MIPDRVKPEYIESRISAVAYDRPIGTLTVCYVTLDNGYTVIGKSACVDPAVYDRDIGEQLAYEDAYEQLWPLFGFLLAEQKYRTAA